jgi:hypothetical protein
MRTGVWYGGGNGRRPALLLLRTMPARVAGNTKKPDRPGGGKYGRTRLLHIFVYPIDPEPKPLAREPCAWSAGDRTGQTAFVPTPSISLIRRPSRWPW